FTERTDNESPLHLRSPRLKPGQKNCACSLLRDCRQRLLTATLSNSLCHRPASTRFFSRYGNTSEALAKVQNGTFANQTTIPNASPVRIWYASVRASRWRGHYKLD